MHIMEGESFTNQASQIWTMLDDMAQSNPDAYRKFVDKHIKEGKDMFSSPKPYICIKTQMTLNKQPFYINLCSWNRVTKPKDESSPIPMFGSNLIKSETESGPDYYIAHVALHPEVLKDTDENEAERDAIIQIVMLFLEYLRQVKLSRTYRIEKQQFKGDTTHIREDFGLSPDPMQDMSKLKDFLPVADIVTKDDSMAGELKGLIIDSNKQLSDHLSNPETKCHKALIEEVYTSPTFTLDESKSDQIKVSIQLDNVNSVTECLLEVTDHQLFLEASNYKLKLNLNSKVVSDKTKAKFSKTKHQLTVTLVKST